MFRSLPVLAVASVIAASPIASPPIVAPATTAAAVQAAAAVACADLAVELSCTVTAADFPDGASITIPDHVDTVAVLVAGGTGAPGSGSDGGDNGGVGTLLYGEIDVANDRTLTAWLGQSGANGGAGWSRGGAGGEGRDPNKNGGTGGGSSAVGFASAGADSALLVAGGGGGGGGNSVNDDQTPSGGGLGGAGGNGLTGQAGYEGTANTSNGNGHGGTPEASSDANGQAGLSWQAPSDTAGGGGGGGGAVHGGGGGQNGALGACRDTGHSCQRGLAPGGGGGGASGDSFVDQTVENSIVATALRGDGYVTVILGASAHDLQCGPHHTEPLTLPIPPDVDKYFFVMQGGAGFLGENHAGGQGTGSLVTGSFETTNMTSLDYWVGCSPYHFGAAGYGTPGDSGNATDDDDYDGGGGGAASLLAIGGIDDFVPIAAAGGGGGAGGDADCLPDCSNKGGQGGTYGGADGTSLAFNGGGGESDFTAPTGGCTACESDQNGNEGSSAETGGSGGGGGSGYPRGGDGGNTDGDASGGGGGAGESYVSPLVENPVITASGSLDSGFIVLIPLTYATTTLTVTKQVTGPAAAYAKGPFYVEVACTSTSGPDINDVLALEPGGSQVMDDVPLNSTCELVETGTGGATVAPPATKVTVSDGPATATLTNEFNGAPLTVSLHSQTSPAGSTFPLAAVKVRVECTFDGETVVLGAPVADGELTFAGDATWSTAELSVTAPIGAACAISQPVPLGHPTIAYPDGTFGTVTADGLTLDIVNTYPLGSVTIAKQTSGPAPAGVEYTVQFACTFGGEPITLADDVVTLESGASGTVDGIPADAACTATETVDGGAEAVHYAPSRTVIAGDNPTITVTNTFVEGSLHIPVFNSGPGAIYANIGTTVEVLCTLDDVTVLNTTVPVPAGGALLSYPVPANSSCTATETATGGATSVVYGDRPVIIPATGSAQISIDNVFEVAPLDVVVTNTGDGALYANAPSAVGVTCSFNGLEIPALTGVALGFGAHGGSAMIPQVVQGATCDVVETTPAGQTSTIIDAVDGDPTTPLTDGIRVTVTSAGPTAEFEHAFELGAVDVSKAVIGDAASFANTDFRVEVTCTFNGHPVQRIGAGGVATLEFAPDGTLRPGYGATALESLNDGTTCTALETEDGGASTVAYSPASTTAPGSIAITNTFDSAPLSVDVVLGGNDQDAHAADRFFFDLACEFNGLPTPPIAPFWLDATGSFSTELPVGAECDATEKVDQHATRVLPAHEQHAPVPTGGVTLTFTNVFDVAPLIVRQVLTGPGAPIYGQDATFAPQLRCTYPDGNPVPLPDGGYVELSELVSFEASFEVPVGITCSVHEEFRNYATSTTFTPPVTILAGEEHTLEITTDWQFGTIDVATLAHGTNAASARFDYTTSCFWNSAEHPIELVDAADASFTQGTGDVRTITALQRTNCRVTQTDADGALRIVVAATGPGAVALTDAADVIDLSPERVRFTFENFLPGSLPVTGSEVGLGVLGALGGAALLLAGGILLRVHRRRRHASGV